MLLLTSPLWLCVASFFLKALIHGQLDQLASDRHTWTARAVIGKSFKLPLITERPEQLQLLQARLLTEVCSLLCSRLLEAVDPDCFKLLVYGPLTRQGVKFDVPVTGVTCVILGLQKSLKLTNTRLVRRVSNGSDL